ncbi:cation-translocating P-type ATPase [Chitinophaga lutea]|uniref:Cation-translocating P-type ATPase n=1 Tax=Chitinophaga lutea TaxID=2488634 RepID=A0A3N4PM28_9BACT|nr:cation-translocating P-type ATPase [Chitinophaga lutea]RPE08628.1 cation-translocating P-type ATPase [Chitinophaga lutea]
MESYFTSLTALQQQSGTDLQQGLSPETAAERLQQYGPNAITGKRSRSPWMIWLHQFKSPVVYLLLVAAGMSIFFKEWLDAIAIGIVILLNAVVGFVMEFQAERSMEALQKLATQMAKVIRGGKLQEVPSEELVPGDIMVLEAGDMVLADGRLLSATNLQADESALTGESVPVEKEPGELEENTPLAERTNMVYKGTFIRKGNAHVLCTATGMQTELGHIATMVAGAVKSATPLEKKLESFSKRLIGITVIIVLLIFGAGLLNKVPVLEMLKTAIALAVAAIPEGLPIVATLALARGMIRMARHQVIVKKLSAVETLGATTVICTDKTGTLTENQMEVTAASVPSGEVDLASPPDAPDFKQLQLVAVLCNNASLDDKKGIGDPLEVSLLEFARDTGADVARLAADFPREKEFPFDSDTKVMGTLHRSGNGYLVAAKGAIENLMPLCTQVFKDGGPQPLEEGDKKTWLAQTDKLAASGLKTLGYAYAERSTADGEFMQELVFTGVTGFLDPPRKDVQQVIRETHTAGIRVIMLTGDHPATAANIAQQLGISKDDKVMNGKDMGKDPEQWLGIPVFARVSPAQKLDLVQALQERREIVAMTGDGVNDAPALKKADIGIAMGIRGTQVSQEVADMVLKDDAFSSIVHAVRQGRVIFENIRRFIIFLLSCNLSELLVIGLIATFNFPFQLFALQILFINLITDVFPAMALGFTEGDDTVMQKQPKDPKLPIISKKNWAVIWGYAAIICAAALGAAFMADSLRGTSDPGAANNVLFFTLIISQLLHSLNMTTGRERFFRGPVIRNPYLWGALGLSLGVTLLCRVVPPVAEALRLQDMSGEDWLVIAGCSIASLLLIRLMALFVNR